MDDVIKFLQTLDVPQDGKPRPIPKHFTAMFWNHIMREFLTNLLLLFPENTYLQEYLDYFEELSGQFPAKPMRLTVPQLKKFAKQITEKDDDFFLEHWEEVPFLKKIHFKPSMWRELEEDNQEAIWTYLNNLYTFGSLLSRIPPSVITNAQKAATQYLKDDVAREEFIKEMESAKDDPEMNELVKSMNLGMFIEKAQSAGKETIKKEED